MTAGSHRKVEEESGRTRLKSSAQSGGGEGAGRRVNRERLEKGRTGRFDPFLWGEEQGARAKRNKLSSVSGLLGWRIAAEARRARAPASL
jgi:hypothetical protein